ncbi:MAG: type II toxin-antitoxin system RelE/ParE family toxin [Patescibacteria group bacterium]
MAKSFDIVFSENFKNIIRRLQKKNKTLYDRLNKKIIEIANNPHLGKPLRNVLKNRWRVQIGSFVLVYRINENEIRFLDFDHHDRIYNN